MEEKILKDSLERISLLNIQKVLINSLALEDYKISYYHKIVDLGAEQIDFLDIFYRLGIPFQNYTSGGRINEDGINLLKKISKDYLVKKDESTAKHFEELANSKSTKQFINQLLVKDLEDIYYHKHKQA